MIAELINLSTLPVDDQARYVRACRNSAGPGAALVGPYGADGPKCPHCHVFRYGALMRTDRAPRHDHCTTRWGKRTAETSLISRNIEQTAAHIFSEPNAGLKVAEGGTKSDRYLGVLSV